MRRFLLHGILGPARGLRCWLAKTCVDSGRGIARGWRMNGHGRFAVYGALIALVLAGCVTGSAPQTPADLREAVSSAAMGQIITGG
jgi:hypothetical protein